MATQSPYFLDQFEPQDVLVADRRLGATEFTRLRIEDVADELDEFSLGELWNTNKFGGRPGGELLA